MQFGITIPLERFFKLKKPPYGEPLDDLFCWELHVVLLQGRPALIGENCATRFAFVLAGIRQEDKDHLAQMAKQEIRDSFQDMGISPGFTESYLKEAGALEITKTHGRSQVAYLNKAVDLMMWNDIAADPHSARQPVLNDILNRTPTKCTGHTEPEPPVERMLERLERLAGDWRSARTGRCADRGWTGEKQG